MNSNRELYERALAVMPHGVSSPVRAHHAVDGHPLPLASAKGAKVVDLQGHSYVDLVSAYGAILLGHAHPRVRQAVAEAGAQGLNVAAPQEAEVALAERIIYHHPAAERVRFVNSGTEAVMSALRLARGITDRDLILKFDGCYHGHWDPLLVKAGSGALTFGEGSSAGVPEATVADTAVLPLDDPQALDRFFAAHGEQLAAAIIEPVGANAGLLPQTPAFLKRLETKCREHGALFVLDEIVTGFRFGWGGVTQRYNLDPDLVTLGKAIGGGLPIGAYAGRAELFEHLSPTGSVYQAGTASGNQAAMAAGNAVLDELEAYPGPFHALEITARDLAEEASDLLAEHGATARAEGPLAWIAFHPEPLPRRAGFLAEGARKAYAGLHRAAREEGLILPPSPFEVLFPTLAFDTETVDEVLARLDRALERMQLPG